MKKDFVFVRPSTAEEAAAVYREETSEGRNAVYWGGGTELLSMSRTGKISPDLGIDLKTVPEVTAIEKTDSCWVFGAGLPLNRAAEAAGSFLFDCFDGIADHTIRNRLTLGGNLCGRLPYRETMLPLLAADSTAVIHGPDGRRSVALRVLVRKGRPALNPGEFLVSVEFKSSALTDRYYCRRHTGRGPVAYPLLTLLVVPSDAGWFIGHSGLQPFPGWITTDAPGKVSAGWLEAAAAELSGKIRSDAAASAEYRSALLSDALKTAAETLNK